MQARLLIVEDDDVLRTRLARAMHERGFEIRAVATEAEAATVAAAWRPTSALIDLRLAEGNGISVVAELRKTCPGCRSVVLSAYGNIPSVVAAVKAGAIDCLPKPSDADDIAMALRGSDQRSVMLGDHQINPSDARLAHILLIFNEQHQNVSETARRLRMDRRTLQRILARQKLKGTNP